MGQRFSEQDGGMARLIAAVATRRDRAAFVALFEHFAPRVKTWLLRSGIGEATAEELAQETMLTVWRRADSFVPSRAGAAAWIFTIARNLRTDAIRERGIDGPDRNGAACRSDDVTQSAPEEQVSAAHLEGCVRDVFSQLQSEQLRVIEMLFVDGKTHGEIAQEPQIPLDSVIARLHQAVARLRPLLDRPS